jgi:ABC-2 type transport system permease protein
MKHSPIADKLSKDFNIKQLTEDAAMERLKKKSIAEFYEIDVSFSKKLKRGEYVQLIVNRREAASSFSDFDMKVNDYVQRLMLSAMVKETTGQELQLSTVDSSQIRIDVKTDKKTSVGSQIIINLFITLNLFCAIGMCFEIFFQKSERTLRRALTTGNKPSAVIGAILAAQFLMIFIGFALILIAYVFIFDKTMIPQIPIIIFNLMMVNALSLSLAVFVSRIVKNEKLISGVIQMVLYTTCFLGGAFVPFEYLPKGVTYISKLMPQYWAIQSIKDGRYDFSLIVLLFAALLFTAGTTSAGSFAEQ